MTADLTKPDPSPLALIQQLVDRGVSAAELGEFLAMHREEQHRQAEAAYGDSIAKFQRMCPPIKKGREVMNKGGGVRYSFASYDDVMRVAGPLLAQCGISVTFATPTTDTRFEMVMRVRVGSYFEDKPYSAPLPDVAKIADAMYMTEPQAWGLILAYHKRYCLCQSLNIVVTDEDNDCALPANGNHNGPITEEQAEELDREIEKRLLNPARYLTGFLSTICGFPVENTRQIPAKCYPKIVTDLMNRNKEEALRRYQEKQKKGGDA